MVQHTSTQRLSQLQLLLKKFSQVFWVSEGLPPSHDVDHHIPIRAGIDPVNARPYC